MSQWYSTERKYRNNTVVRMGWGPWYQERKQARLDIKYGAMIVFTKMIIFTDDDDDSHEEDDDGDDDCIGMSGPVMSGWCS